MEKKIELGARDSMSYYFYHHLELLSEWNEESSYFATASALLCTDLGTQVVQDVDERQRQYTDGEFTGLGPATKIQVHAIYGDEDELKRLTVYGNAGKPECLVYGQVIRG